MKEGYNYLGISLIVLLIALHLSWAFYEPAFTIIEPDSAGMFGWSLVCGDFDTDGANELVIGAPVASSLDGKVYVYDLSDISMPTGVINAPTNRAQIGISLSKLDFDGDGFIDLAVGSNGAYSTGAVFIYCGGPEFDNNPDFILKGENPVDNFGFSIVSLKDINSDGKDELAVGALYADITGYRSGAVYVFLGGDTLPHTTLAPPDSLEDFGACLASCDFDDDGLFDLAVGAPEAAAWLTKPGSIFLYKASSLVEGDANFWKQFSGELVSSSFGNAIAPLIDNTGADKLIVGAYNFCLDDSCTGRIYILDSSGVIWSFTGECGNAQVGSSVSTIDDFLLNGYYDWSISANGCPDDSCEDSRVIIFSGGPNFPEHPFLILCDTSTNFGWAMLSLPNFIGDPAPEIAIGAPNYAGRGKVLIYPGIWSPNTIYAEIIRPLPHWFVADSVPVISFLIRSLVEVDWSSAICLIGEDTVPISHSGDTLFITSAEPFHDGDTVRVCLTELTSIWNDPFDGPVCTEFFIDLKPPEIIGTIPPPGEQIHFIPQGIAWLIKENGSLDTASISVEINGAPVRTHSIRYGTYWLLWCQDTFPDDNILYVELSNIKDLPDMGLSNETGNWLSTYNIGRTWIAEIEASTHGKLPQKLTLGQFDGTTDGIDMNYDILFFPNIQRTMVAFTRSGTLLKRDFEPENYVTSWHIVNMETCSVALRWKPDEFPDGAVYINRLPMHRDSITHIAPDDTLEIVADFTGANFFATPFEEGWNLLGYCNPEYCNSVHLWCQIAEMPPICLINSVFQLSQTIPEGYGFWVFAHTKGINGTWIHTKDTISVNLVPGWNIIAPFNNARLEASPPMMLPEMWGWNGSMFYFEDTTKLGNGYYIFSLDSTKLLIIDE